MTSKRNNAVISYAKTHAALHTTNAVVRSILLGHLADYISNKSLVDEAKGKAAPPPRNSQGKFTKRTYVSHGRRQSKTKGKTVEQSLPKDQTLPHTPANVTYNSLMAAEHGISDA